MRLGKEQAAGFVEDTGSVSETEELLDFPERTLVTPEPAPAVTAG